MPIRIRRRRRFPALPRHLKLDASLPGEKPQGDAGEEGLLCECLACPPRPWDFSLLSDDDEDDTDEESARAAAYGSRDSDEPLISRFVHDPPDEIVYTLAGPSFLASYLGVVHGEFVIPDWDYFCWDDHAAADHQDDATDEEEREQGKSGTGEDISDEEYIGFLDVLPRFSPCVNDLLFLNIDQRIKLYERHTLYRIKACKLLQGHSIDSLDDAKLQRMYPSERLMEKGYFRCYEENGTFGWFFHPDHCKLAALDDYQRLVLLNDGGYEYMQWDNYRCNYLTHDIDREYVKYCETVSEELRWLEDYVALDVTCRHEWRKLSNKAALQAMKIATRFTKISVGLARLAFQEYKSRLFFYFRNLEELDGVYFEIWKRVIKQQKSFREAVKEVYELNKFPLRQNLMKYALSGNWSLWETKFHTCTAGIHGQIDESKARWLITRTLEAMFKRPKGYEEYARKKLKIAELIGLIPKAST
ncbi:hypothetical protein EJB05_32379 [Eragrostis curvula]|uniref:Uncharacterized protein n=1 Tax=Eragrostis curvula TaxID=38414 RepID=A0A5J9UGV0_9POAL|nr:hypothetical protein EJB05_32379 [Eragrostis curvula]